MDIRTATRHLKTELRTLNKAIGALEDSLEQLVAAKYEEHMRKAAAPAGKAAAVVMPGPGTLLQRMGRAN